MALSQVQQLQQISSTFKSCAQTAFSPLPRLQGSSNALQRRQQRSTAHICRAVESEQQQRVQVQPEAAVPGMSAYLDSLIWAKDGLVPVIVQVRSALQAVSSVAEAIANSTSLG